MRVITTSLIALAITISYVTAVRAQGGDPPHNTPQQVTPTTVVTPRPVQIQTIQQPSAPVPVYIQANPTITPLDQRSGLLENSTKLNTPQIKSLSVTTIQQPNIINSYLLAPGTKIETSQSKTEVTNVTPTTTVITNIPLTDTKVGNMPVSVNEIKVVPNTTVSNISVPVTTIQNTQSTINNKPSFNLLTPLLNNLAKDQTKEVQDPSVTKSTTETPTTTNGTASTKTTTNNTSNSVPTTVKISPADLVRSEAYPLPALRLQERLLLIKLRENALQWGFETDQDIRMEVARLQNQELHGKSGLNESEKLKLSILEKVSKFSSEWPSEFDDFQKQAFKVQDADAMKTTITGRSKVPGAIVILSKPLSAEEMKNVDIFAKGLNDRLNAIEDLAANVKDLTIDIKEMEAEKRGNPYLTISASYYKVLQDLQTALVNNITLVKDLWGKVQTTNMGPSVANKLKQSNDYDYLLKVMNSPSTF